MRMAAFACPAMAAWRRGPPLLWVVRPVRLLLRRPKSDTSDRGGAAGLAENRGYPDRAYRSWASPALLRTARRAPRRRHFDDVPMSLGGTRGSVRHPACELSLQPRHPCRAAHSVPNRVETPDVPSVEQGPHRAGRRTLRRGSARPPARARSPPLPACTSSSSRRASTASPRISATANRKQARDPVRGLPRGPARSTADHRGRSLSARALPRRGRALHNAAVPFTIGRCGPQRPHAAYVR